MVLNQKGGVGKSTIATYLVELEGYRVCLVDPDKQGTARDWRDSQENGLPVYGMESTSLEKDIKPLSDAFDVVVIDGAAKIEAISVSAI